MKSKLLKTSFFLFLATVLALAVIQALTPIETAAQSKVVSLQVKAEPSWALCDITSSQKELRYEND